MRNNPALFAFYKLQNNEQRESRQLDKKYQFAEWKPKIFSMMPSSMLLSRHISARFKIYLAFWSILHTLRLFGSLDYKVYIIFNGEEIIHYTVLLPRHFRYPFMSKSDLSIGPLWTSENCRRQGLSRFVATHILKQFPDREFWYVVREDNLPSRHFAENIGFLKYGSGMKVKRTKFTIDTIG